MSDKKRCAWVDENSDIYKKYHDEEWGVPVHDERLLFEFLILEGAQAGLSWLTILKRRENYRKAFDNFDVEKVAAYNKEKIAELLDNEGIIRNRLKVNAAVKNARAFIEIQKEYGSFNDYLWGFVNHKPIKNSFSHISELPASTPLSEKISKDLKKRGMSFVGPTIIYAMMQGIGMVNDHETGCFRYNQV